MKSYGIEMEGEIIIQKVTTLPVWGATDEARIVYAEDVNKYYIGNDSEWLEILTPTLSVAKGGTGAATLADGGLVIGNDTGAVEVVIAGAATEVLVGGGASTKPAWGTNIPTAVTIGNKYVYRADGTDVPVADGGTGSSNAADGFTALKQDATSSATGVIELATNAEVAAFADESRAVTPEGLGYAMAGVLAYGVQWDEDESSPTLTRTGALAGIAAASSPGNTCLPIQSAMRRCILNDDGTVNYYLSATDSTKKEDGTTASVLDGTDGQVMVEIPRFAYKYSYVAATNVHSWSISSVLLPGYEWHPAFYKDGAWVDHRYIGAYEGIGYDNGTTAYVDCGTGAADNWSGTTIDVANDKLGSVSGFAPMMDETRDEFRDIALNRGAGWRQQDYYLTSAVQLLYLVEYASFYSQSVIGMGRTELSGGTWVKDSYIGVTGKSNADGNATANTGGNTNDAYMSYRGIENFYGNLYQWIDGFNIYDNIPYVSNTETDFADDTATAYTRLTDTGGSGITLYNANDYQSTLEQTKGGFLSSAGGGGTNTYITDYYYQAADWRVTRFGGSAADTGVAGAFYWYLAGDAADDSVRLGSRTSY